MLLLLLWAGGVRAGWVEDALAFAGGLAAGLVVHELGHVVVARAYGEKLDWREGLWECRYPCENLSKVAVAGNMASALTGEVLLHTARRGAFIDGLQTWNTINPICYAIKDARSRGGYYDYAHVDDTVQVALAIHAASVGYRHLSDEHWRIRMGARSISFSRDF